MRCLCGENMGRLSKGGEPMLRNAGLILKAEGVHAVCPACKAAVPIAGDMAKALSARLLVVFQKPRRA